MRKINHNKFALEDYSDRQLHVLRSLMARYPQFKWKQLLSPYHCTPIYEEFMDIGKEESVFDVFNQLIGKFGNITVYLDYALRLFINAREHREPWHYDDAYWFLRNRYDEDGDKLATIVMRDLNCGSVPVRTHVYHRREIELTDFILREPIDQEGLEWCLDYLGWTEDDCNIVSVWNINKKRYEQYLRELQD